MMQMLRLAFGSRAPVMAQVSTCIRCDVAGSLNVAIAPN
jgi:hypothetical protein